MLLVLVSRQELTASMVSLASIVVKAPTLEGGSLISCAGANRYTCWHWRYLARSRSVLEVNIVMTAVVIIILRPGRVFTVFRHFHWFHCFSTHGTAFLFNPIPGQGKRGLSLSLQSGFRTNDLQAGCMQCRNTVLIPLHGQEIHSHGGRLDSLEQF
jgi:hypothetical protein